MFEQVFGLLLISSLCLWFGIGGYIVDKQCEKEEDQQ